MRLVAVGAVLHDRRVLPEKWPAALGMTAVAVLVNRCLDELAWVRAAMRIVATGAGDFAFAVRHVRRALQLRPPHLVTGEAKFRLGFLRADMLGEWSAISRLCQALA